MASTVEERTYEEALSWLRDHGFDLIEAPGTQARVFLKKYNCSAAIQKNGDEGVKIFAYPGYLIGSEISKLVNKGYQQFLKTSKTEVPATADHLKALQQFTEELKEGLGCPACTTNRSVRSASRITTTASRIATSPPPTGPSVPGKRPESSRSPPKRARRSYQAWRDHSQGSRRVPPLHFCNHKPSSAIPCQALCCLGYSAADPAVSFQKS